MNDITNSYIEAKHAFAHRLISTLSPEIINGIRKIFDETTKTCIDLNEEHNYLCAFQIALSKIPSWSNTTIDNEKNRIIKDSQCSYLGDLLSCAHLMQIKILTCINIGNRQKKIDLNIPDVSTFIHRTYIQVARKIYKNVYLFERNKTGLDQQRSNRELELMVQDCILETIYENIPTEHIIRAYLDDSMEEEEEIIIEPIPQEKEMTKKEIGKKNEKMVPTKINDTTDISENSNSPIHNISNEPVVTQISFNEMDHTSDGEFVKPSRKDFDSSPNEKHQKIDFEQMEEIDLDGFLENKQPLKQESNEIDEKYNIADIFEVNELNNT